VPKPVREQVQEFIRSMEEGRGAAILLRFCVVLGFIGLAMFYDLTRNEGFSTQEAMESAHCRKAIRRRLNKCCNRRCRI
jgi:hypothetical protein